MIKMTILGQSPQNKHMIKIALGEEGGSKDTHTHLNCSRVCSYQQWSIITAPYKDSVSAEREGEREREREEEQQQ